MKKTVILKFQIEVPKGWDKLSEENKNSIIRASFVPSFFFRKFICLVRGKD